MLWQLSALYMYESAAVYKTSAYLVLIFTFKRANFHKPEMISWEVVLVGRRLLSVFIANIH